ncbi:MAG TPA: M1 family metallopeptidase [Thermoanaerobaculia bacterium]|nr:M1 family metallopeptidase [Thermoanaerobaculia bacterium]
MRLAALVSLFAFAAPFAAGQSAQVDVLHYAIELALPREGTEITAVAELTLLPKVAPLETLTLDFGALTIDHVEAGGEEAPFTREGDRVTVRVAREDQEPFRVRIRYHGSPADGLVLRANKHGDWGAFADNWPNRAHHWFPSIDHPSDKATVDFTVTAPEAFDVVANGSLVETTSLQNGNKLWRWRESTPIPVHCMVVGATQFAVVSAGEDDGVEISYYLYPRDRGHGTQFGRAVQILDFFSATIGPYPYDKLAIVESSTRFGGMENASAIFLDEKRIHGKEDLERLVAHEIAHQWFGDSVSQRDWYDLWLSEGFATYFAALFAERTGGVPAFRAAMADARALYLGAAGASARPIHDPSITDLTKLLNRLNYQKGAWVLHMLRGVVGDAAFFAGIREYYATYRNGNASTAELRAIMERHAGQPLEWFFRQWIYEPGHPVFSTKWAWREGKVQLDVAQTQQGTVFRMPATVELRDAAGSRRQRVVIDERSERFELESPLEPSEVVLDPDEWILRE